MPVVNATVAAIFDEIADLLDIQGANTFRNIKRSAAVWASGATTGSASFRLTRNC